jgi:hypothetical protein
VVAAREGVAWADADGLTLYPWAEVHEVRIGAVAGSPCVLVSLAPEAAPHRMPRSGEALTGAQLAHWALAETRERARTHARIGFDFAWMGAATLDGPGPLVLRIWTAISDPDTREALPAAHEVLAWGPPRTWKRAKPGSG